MNFVTRGRILKQVGSVSALTDIDHVYVASLCGDGQTIDEKINRKASVKRFPCGRRVGQKSGTSPKIC